MKLLRGASPLPLLETIFLRMRYVNTKFTGNRRNHFREIALESLI